MKRAMIAMFAGIVTACGTPLQPGRDGGRPQDAARLNDASVYEASCAAPSEPRPEASLRSCSGPDGAPLEHCREVWGCGGIFTMGSPNAFTERRGEFAVMNAPCDIAPVRVRPGFIDAYEVSVARFRAWVRAGRPPGDQTLDIPPRVRWNFHAGFSLEVYRTQSEPPLDDQPQPQFCTYRDESGPNDNLPINCVGVESALAFCLWEGKHLVTEAMWEWFATNGGRTRLPFSDVRANTEDLCEFGDVARYTGCARDGHLPAPIDAFPLGQTTNPPGVFGLWGGVRELAWSSRPGSFFNPDQCFVRPPGVDEDGRAQFINHGRDFLDVPSLSTAFDDSSTRSTRPSDRSRSLGFRCARWVPETLLPGCFDCGG